MHDFIKLIASAIFVCVLAIVFVVRDFNRGYPMRPGAFRNQIHALKPGMTKPEVKAKIAGSTHIEETSDTLVFTMDPEKPGLITLRVGQHIEVKFDRDGKMTNADWSDG